LSINATNRVNLAKVLGCEYEELFPKFNKSPQTDMFNESQIQQRFLAYLRETIFDKLHDADEKKLIKLYQIINDFE